MAGGCGHVTAAEQSTYCVTWSEEDGEHVALCLELPSLSCLANTPAEALERLIATVEEVVEDMAASGETIPEPLSKQT